MNGPPDDLETYVTAMAATLGLPIAPESRPLVIANLRGLLAAAALVLEFPLPEDVQAPSVFRP